MAISESLGDLRTLEIEDGRIEYRIRGEGAGPTVVFLHGIIANADVWRGVVSDLASDHRCVAPDWPLGGHRLGMRPGTDFSLPGSARRVERFLIAARLDQVVLVANDTGGAVAQYVVAAHPQRIAGLVLTPATPTRCRGGCDPQVRGRAGSSSRSDWIHVGQTTGHEA